jgi:CHAT domain-containing protein
VLEGTDYSIEKAQTRLDFARCLLKSGDPVLEDEGQHHINTAEQLFKDEGHVFGLLDLMDMQVSEKKITPLKDLLDWKLSCADLYFEKACYQQGIRCLIFAVPVNTDMGEVFQKTQSIIERARSKIAHVGGVILEQGLFVNAVAQSLVRAPEYGYARKILEEYMDHLPDEIGPKLLGSLYQSLRGAYTNIGDFDKALSYAEQALIVSLEGATYTDISDAAFILAVSKTDRGHKLPNRSPLIRLWHSNTITFLSGWISVDRLMGYHQQEVDKCCWLAFVENTMAHMFEDEEAFKRSDQWLHTAQESCNSYRITAKQLIELEIARATRIHDFDLAVTLAFDRLRSLQADPLITPFNLAQATIAASMMTYQRCCSRSQAAASQSEEEKRAAVEDLVEALKLASQAFDLYSASGGSEMIVTALNWMYDLIRHFPSESFHDLMSNFLVEAEKIEAFCDAVRRSSASTRGTSSLLEKRGLISGNQFRSLYSNAIEICMDLGDLPAAWLWIQKSKARALSDLFGSRALIPPFLLQTITSDQDARELYEKDLLATEAALKGGPLGYLNARRQAESIRAEMRKHPQLSQILDIREGSFNLNFYEPELTNVAKLSNMDPKSIKYVDWFISSSRDQEDKIIRLVRQVDGVTSSQVLTITKSIVERWKSRIFNFPAEAEPPLRREDARGRMRELASLIAGLEQTTNESDMLILSPSGILNGIPLHALPLGKRTLVERNPVIYSSSAALFRHCHIRAASQSSQAYEHAEKAAFLAVYESSTPEEQAEQSQIYSHAQQINTDTFPFEVHTGSAVTKSLFEQTAQTSSWIHYHGHALFDKHDPLRSCLVLHNTPTPPPSNEGPPTPPFPPTTNLTVSSIFSIPMLTTAPHFTIIACDSGSQDIAPGDEPLGIVSALLYAGGISVLGALWPVDSHTARNFTELFYDDLRQQIETLSRDVSAEQRFVVLNLAAALRNTVIKMMDRSSLETKAPLHWAGYVLHGAWFHVYPLKSRDSVHSRVDVETPTRTGEER